MGRLSANILILGCVAAWSLVPTFADDADGTVPPLKPPKGSLARQLLLKYRLEKIANGTLTASLDHNRSEWESFSPEMRRRYRDEALAFLKSDPARQKKLLEHYEKFAAMSAEKRREYRLTARWVKAVVATLTPAQRKNLLEMRPDDRAKFLRDRRDELVRAGRLTLEGPTTAPAAAAEGPAPARQPAEQTIRPSSRTIPPP